jgi:hypothetical protein
VPDACPVVPNNGGGKTYDVVITPNVSVTFDASGTVVSTLELSGGLQDDGHSPTLTVGNLLTGQAGANTINWRNRSTLAVTGSMDGGFQSETNVYGGSLLSIGGDYTVNMGPIYFSTEARRSLAETLLSWGGRRDHQEWQHGNR